MKHDIPNRVLDRVWASVEIGDWFDCWPWQKSTGSHGYGQIGWHDRDLGRSVMTTAHRVAWVAVNGPIPDELQVDHTCYNRPCCNPLHLRLLTLVENARDTSYTRHTHCPQGHPFTEENTYRIPKTGHRTCRSCQRNRVK